MFPEQHTANIRKGRIEAICGCMFSGKTEELIRRIRLAQTAQQNVAVFKPAIDTRYDFSDIVSHDATRISATPVASSADILLLAAGADVIAIDEAQFFDDELPGIAESFARKGIRVIIAGLDMDYLGKPFGPLPALLSGAEYITKLHAVCMQCGDLASYSYRKTTSGAQVLLGEQETYEPRCRDCFYNKV